MKTLIYVVAWSFLGIFLSAVGDAIASTLSFVVAVCVIQYHKQEELTAEALKLAQECIDLCEKTIGEPKS